MSRNILVVNGHPDPRPDRFCAALCDAFAGGAQSRGWNTHCLNVGALKMPVLADHQAAEPEAWMDVEAAFRLVRWANRLAIVYPLWASEPPAGLRQLFDYITRLHLLLGQRTDTKSARIVVTTSFPAVLYRAKLSEMAQPLALPGIQPEATTFIGSIETISFARRARWLAEMRCLGEACN